VKETFMGTFRAGAARSVITPNLGTHIEGYFFDRTAKDIYDDLYAKALVLESGGQSLAVVACDVCALTREIVAEARERVGEMTGIPEEHILIAATHTHYGPNLEASERLPANDEYIEWLPGRIGDSVRLAQNRLKPAVVGHAAGACAEEAHNRRYRMKDGSVRTNPGVMNPDIVEPAGPIDPEVGVLAIVGEERDPICVLANYALHYVGGPYLTAIDDTINADYFGAFDRAVQRMAGTRLVGMVLNGCCGDINNIDVFSPAPERADLFYDIERVGDVISGEAFKAWRTIETYDASPQLGAARETFTFHRPEVTEDQLAAAQARLDRATREDAESASSGDPEYLLAHTALAMAKAPPERDAEIQALRIGQTGLVGLPGEVFVELGLDLKRRSPFERTLVAELANDCIGYIPTDAARTDPSYEVYTSPTVRGSGPAMIDCAVRLLEGMAS
jgi:hypothetical protein